MEISPRGMVFSCETHATSVDHLPEMQGSKPHYPVATCRLTASSWPVDFFDMKTVLYMFLSCWLAGCVTSDPARPYDADTRLADGEGVLVLVIHSANERESSLFFKGLSHNVQSPRFPRGVTTVALRVPADNYEMRSIQVGSRKLLAEDYVTFTVKSGSVTYPGDIALTSRSFGLTAADESRVSILLDRLPSLKGLPLHIDGRLVESRRNIQKGIEGAPRLGDGDRSRKD